MATKYFNNTVFTSNSILFSLAVFWRRSTSPTARPTYSIEQWYSSVSV